MQVSPITGGRAGLRTDVIRIEDDGASRTTFFVGLEPDSASLLRFAIAGVLGGNFAVRAAGDLSLYRIVKVGWFSNFFFCRSLPGKLDWPTSGSRAVSALGKRNPTPPSSQKEETTVGSKTAATSLLASMLNRASLCPPTHPHTGHQLIGQQGLGSREWCLGTASQGTLIFDCFNSHSSYWASLSQLMRGWDSQTVTRHDQRRCEEQDSSFSGIFSDCFHTSLTPFGMLDFVCWRSERHLSPILRLSRHLSSLPFLIALSS